MATKESDDVVAFLNGLAGAIAGAKEDGEINWKDIPEVFKLATLARDAVTGSDGILGEIKNASGEELDHILGSIAGSLANLVAAIATKGA